MSVCSLPFISNHSEELTVPEHVRATFYLEGTVTRACSTHACEVEVFEKMIGFVCHFCLSPPALGSTLPSVSTSSHSQTARSSSWHARYTVLTYLQTMVFYNLFIFLNNEDAVKDIRWLVISLLEDEQLEVKFMI